MRGIGNRLRIVFAATGFNLLFEYSMRGVNNLLAKPILMIFLMGIYFSYFMLVDDLIRRYRLRDYHLVVIGFTFGCLSSLILPGSVTTPPTYLGINWINLIYVNIGWWGIVQGIITFYIATRITPRRWDTIPLSRIWWIAFSIAIIGIYLVFRIYARNIQAIEPVGIRLLIIFSIIGVLVLRKLVTDTEREIPKYSPIIFMDIVSISTIAVFILSSIFLSHGPTWISIHYVNLPALRLITIWTLIVSVVVVIYRVLSSKEIPV